MTLVPILLVITLPLDNISDMKRDLLHGVIYWLPPTLMTLVPSCMNNNERSITRVLEVGTKNNQSKELDIF